MHENEVFQTKSQQERQGPEHDARTGVGKVGHIGHGTQNRFNATNQHEIEHNRQEAKPPGEEEENRNKKQMK